MYMNLYKCFIGSVYLVSYTDFKKSENIYCGIHSLIVNYQFFRKVNVGIKSLYRVQYKVVVTYSIIDCCGIRSSSLMNSLQKQSLTIKWQLYIPLHNISAINIFISVVKYQQLTLYVQKNFFSLVEVYDGPEISSEGVMPLTQSQNSSKYLLSSFQCITTFWLQSSDFSKVTDHVLNFSSMMSPSSQNINLLPHNATIFKYPEMCKDCSTTILQITNSLNYHINLFIETLSYKGQNNILCKYAGLVAYDLLKGHFQESRNICNVVKGYKFRDTYLKGSKSILVIYVFPEHGSLTTNIILSKTKCKVIIINVSVLDMHCNVMGSYCTDFRNIKTKERFNTNCVGNPYCSDIGRSFFDFRVEKCVIFQSHHDTNQYEWLPEKVSHWIFKSWNLLFCRLAKFRHVPILEGGKSIKYTVTGFLSGMLIQIKLAICS